MDLLALVVGVAGALLLVAGASKLVRPDATGAALAAVGRPTPSGAVRALGALELAAGVGAVATGNAVLVLLVAALYAGFACFVVLALRRDVASCGCFGASGARPGAFHLAVNLLLAAGAAGAALTGARSLPAVLGDEPLGVVGVVLGVVGTYLVLTRAGGSAVAPAPAGAGAAGRVAGIDLGAGRTALVFLSTTCLTCREIWLALGTGSSPLPAGVRAVVVTKDSERADAVRALAPPGVATVQDSASWDRFGVTVAPAVVLVDDGEVVATGLAGSWDEVVALSAHRRQALGS